MNTVDIKNNDISYLGSHASDNKHQGDSTIVDIKKGYTRVADELLEALCRMELSGREFRLVLTIIRKTYGFHKPKDYIALSQLADMSGIQKKHISTVIKKLVDSKILLREGQGPIKQYGINPVISEWKLVKLRTKKAPNLEQVSPKMGISTKI
ncbi:replication protein [Zooshikella marina]|uniref:replication protein n=1 Tax=Zooshikella ganghwensis TaxID=202772 RepID=UPI001BB06D1B|nr:replication protein [Zooshikella ganghwensis]MBU2709347.1 replication protein [Zooshikella ganghwensis]